MMIIFININVFLESVVYLLDPNFITKKHLKCYKNKNKPRKKLFKI